MIQKIRHDVIHDTLRGSDSIVSTRLSTMIMWGMCTEAIDQKNVAATRTDCCACAHEMPCIGCHSNCRVEGLHPHSDHGIFEIVMGEGCRLREWVIPEQCWRRHVAVSCRMLACYMKEICGSSEFEKT